MTLAPRRTNDVARLIRYVKSLRTLPAGLDIEPDDSGALVRSSDPGLPKKVPPSVGTMFVFTPLSQTSWHVSLSKSLTDNLSPAERTVAVGETATMLRETFEEPTDLGVEQMDTGVEINVVNPQLYEAFVEKVKRVFAQNSDFALTEAPSLLLRVAPPVQTPLLQSEKLIPLPPSVGPLMEISDEMEKI